MTPNTSNQPTRLTRNYRPSCAKALGSQWVFPLLLRPHRGSRAASMSEIISPSPITKGNGPDAAHAGLPPTPQRTTISHNHQCHPIPHFAAIICLRPTSFIICDHGSLRLVMSAPTPSPSQVTGQAYPHPGFAECGTRPTIFSLTLGFFISVRPFLSPLMD